LGDEHPEALKSVNNLAGLYELQGKYDQAEPLFVNCLAVRRRVLGDEHPDTLSSINDLAFLYKSQGKYEQAEQMTTTSVNVTYLCTRGCDT
jgi:Flp pilus assembly protein TadD